MIPLFRAWWPEEKRYYDVGCIDWRNGDMRVLTHRGYAQELMSPSTVLELFTGVVDTSVERRKIFDGDLIQPTTASYRIVKVVRFVPDRAAFMMANQEDIEKDLLDPWQPLSQRWVDECRAVVIGNIHGVPL